MSDYFIKGQSNKASSRLIIIDESDWSVETNVIPLPNYNDEFNSYSTVVTNSKKLVLIREADGQVSAYGNLDPIFVE
ncbi:MAG: hypothetical protein DRI84_04660 [Bacteroidetes bacterium]|nr:MAG: hypothetical protein DRI84_04660 [Bacteroidota bacterium]